MNRQTQHSEEYPYSKLEPELQKLIEETLTPQEKPLICYRIYFHMLWAIVITSQRVTAVKAYYLKSSFLSRKAKIDMPQTFSMLLSEIDQMELEENPAYETFDVRLTSAAGQHIELPFTNALEANRFLRSLENIRQQHNPTERLKNLDKLYYDKLITPEEYQQKRQSILDEL